MTAAALEGAAKLVDDQRGQGLAVHFLADDQDRLAGLQHAFQHGNEVLVRGDLLLVDEDVGIFELALHLLRIGDEVGRQVAAIELHAFDELVVGLHRLAFLDGDDAVLADLVHGLGDDLADGGVVVGGDGGDVFEVLLVLDGNGGLLEPFDDVLDGLVHATFHEHGIDAADDGAEALVVDRLGQDGRGGGAVAGHVAGLGRNVADHAGADVLVLVLELDFLGHGDAVLGHRGRAEALLQDDVTPLGSERDLDGPGQLGDALADGVAGFLIESNLLGRH